MAKSTHICHFKPYNLTSSHIQAHEVTSSSGNKVPLRKVSKHFVQPFTPGHLQTVTVPEEAAVEEPGVPLLGQGHAGEGGQRRHQRQCPHVDSLLSDSVLNSRASLPLIYNGKEGLGMREEGRGKGGWGTETGGFDRGKGREGWVRETGIPSGRER